MDEKIYQKIYDVAHELSKRESTYTRADLAYELQNEGVKKDSFEIGKLVYEAYNYYNEDETIKNVFYNNEGIEQLVSEYKLNNLIEKGCNDFLFPILYDKLDKSVEVLALLEDQVMQIMSDSFAIVGENKFVNTIVGNQGVVNVKNEAEAVFNNYSNLIDTYSNAKYQVKSIMTDFINLRTRICDVYRKFSAMLIDIFGDSIKAVSPELFDFDSIEWLDVQGMLKNVKLEYDKISEKCQTLMSSIQDNFIQSLKSSSSVYKQMGSKQAGLLVAGLNMVSHYMDANSKTCELKQNLVVLKNSVKRDTTQIKGDLGRLMVIYKTMNDIYIPKAEVFCRNSDTILSAELKAIEDPVYNEAEIRELKNKRDKLLGIYKKLETDMTDEQLNIDIYTARIEENTQVLKGLTAQYDKAKNSKPNKPFFLINFLTFGSAYKRYNRDIYDWSQACKPVISRYEDLQTDVRIDTDELHATEKSLKEDKEQYSAIKKEIEIMNKTINGKINVNDDIKMKILPHLEDLIKLLRLAREIASSKLDDKYMKAICIEDEKMEIPEDIKHNINQFKKTFLKTIDINRKMYQKTLQCTSSEKEETLELGKEKNNSTYVSNIDLDVISESQNAVVQKTVVLLESWANLKAMREQNVVANKIYEKKLKKLQNEFIKDMATIDNKSAILRECLKKINTVQSPEMLKEGLLDLSNGNKKIFNDKDLDEFLNGNKTIEL